jgi:hypothetical protein
LMVEAGANALAVARRARNAIFLNMMENRVINDGFLWKEKKVMDGIYAERK